MSKVAMSRAALRLPKARSMKWPDDERHAPVCLCLRAGLPPEPAPARAS
jgi:hypothetical protein